jgi:hypothetical protein
MSTFRWWIDEPIVRGSGNPGDEDLERLRAQGFLTEFEKLHRLVL